MSFDFNLVERDIQSLDNADALAGFFARLGYSTEKSTVQTRNLLTEPESAYGGKARVALRREDLRLICFDFLSGG